MITLIVELYIGYLIIKTVLSLVFWGNIGTKIKEEKSQNKILHLRTVKNYKENEIKELLEITKDLTSNSNNDIINRIRGQKK